MSLVQLFGSSPTSKKNQQQTQRSLRLEAAQAVLQEIRNLIARTRSNATSGKRLANIRQGLDQIMGSSAELAEDVRQGAGMIDSVSGSCSRTAEVLEESSY